MQYCVSRVRLGADGAIAAAEWGPLDGHRDVLISEATVSEPDELLRLIGRGKLVWATFPTPFGLALGGLLRIGRNSDGLRTLELAPGAAPQRSLAEMARL